MKDRYIVLPIIWISVVLVGWIGLSGCAVSARLMTHAQHQEQTRDRVLIDRRFGDYDQDGFTLQEFRKRYNERLASRNTE